MWFSCIWKKNQWNEFGFDFQFVFSSPHSKSQSLSKEIYVVIGNTVAHTNDKNVVQDEGVIGEYVTNYVVSSDDNDDFFDMEDEKYTKLYWFQPLVEWKRV